MDLYDGGTSLAEIKATVEQLRVGNDDFDEEIFITAFALALWETGELDAQMLRQVQQAIERQAFVKYLTEAENVPSEGRKRQHILDRFWQKINQPNLKIRKRKTRKRQKNFVFDEGAVLAFQMPDSTYRATILLLISQHRGHCDYQFMIPTYVGSAKPTLDDIVTGEIMGHLIESSNSSEYRLGFNVVGIEHNHLRKFADQLELIGSLTIKPAAKRCGIQSGAVNFESFVSDFQSFNDFSGTKKTAKTHPRKVFPVQKIL